MKKPVPKDVTAGELDPVILDDAWGSDHPHIVHFLADLRWDDGTVRVPGTIMLMVDAGWVKGWINDKAGGRAAWLSADTFSALFRAMEEGIASDDLQWRAAVQGRSGRK